jgi:hypothetical protein
MTVCVCVCAIALSRVCMVTKRRDDADGRPEVGAPGD